MTLEVPPGTVVYEKTEDGDLIPLGDLAAVGDQVLVARGGRGGRGNSAFATATNRAPRKHEPGEPGETRTLGWGELMPTSDGGLPNAGSPRGVRVSAAKPKSEDYPFTTLTPPGLCEPQRGSNLAWRRDRMMGRAERQRWMSFWRTWSERRCCACHEFTFRDATP